MPGQTTSPTPHVSTAVRGGTPNVFQPFGSLPFAPPASSTTLLASSCSFDDVGPARSFFLLSKRYQESDVPLFRSACWPARSSYSDSLATGKPPAPFDG